MKERLSKLIDVKSIITFAMIFTLCYLVIVGKIETETFSAMAGSIITYYFTKDKKSE